MTQSAVPFVYLFIYFFTVHLSVYRNEKMKRACHIGMQSLITMESLIGTLVVVKIQLTVRKQSLQFHTHVY